MEITKFTGKKLPLVTDGRLSLFFVGTGSAFAKTMNQNNLLVVKGKDHLLIDCGSKCMQGLFEVGICAPEICTYLITHTHADHIGGLEEVMMTGRYVARKKPNIIITETLQEILWRSSLRGGAAYSELNDGQPLEFNDFWNPLRPVRIPGMPRETWGFKAGSLRLAMPRTMHFPENATSWKDSFWSCSVILDERIFFTSDTRYDPDLILAYDRLFCFDIIFHDCQFMTGGVHASLEELSQLPEKIKRKIILMHYDDNWRNFEELAKTYGFRAFARQYHHYHFPPD